MGTGRKLKAYRPSVQVIAVEPLEALHGLEGLKHMPSSIVPKIYKEEELDGKLSISTEEGWAMAARLLREEGLLLGHSSGAALAGALRVGRQLAERRGTGVGVSLFSGPGERDFRGPPLRRKHQ